jgi:heme-degrading monooxygenase HmoA
MFARVQTVHQSIEKLDELTGVAREQLPAARERPGFKGFCYLVDRQGGKGLVISLWETEEDLRRMEAHAALRQRTEAQAGIQSPPTEIFEVALRSS